MIEPTSGIDDHAGAETEPSGTGRPRWQIAIFQLLFGSMAVALGGLISAEPTLSLDRREDGRLECRYALDAYGWLPTLTASVDDLVRYEVSVGEASGTQGKSSGTPAVFTRTNLRLIGRDGSDFSIGQTFSLLDLDHMIDGSGGPSHSERVAAGPARRYGGRVLGGFGLLLLAGAIWNLGLMASGLGSASAEIG